eukprot:TRINITY_DN3245_c0_g3_i1.p1 TRINITY_DN3245_c0_g3~~TRINITY_DN3245_c0_g3_i1.p1  ORF type:complete len:214 (-),score=23.80 TRINITY_DN3245_c0_g3_i1:251-892(-)
MADRRSTWAVLAACLVLALVPRASHAIRFSVTAYSKCLGEEIQENTVVVASYGVVNNGDSTDHTKITAKVTSPYGHQLHWQDAVEEGHFAFTSKEAGQYLACFWMPHATPGVHSIEIDLEWKIGVAAVDWQSIAKKDKLDGMGLELRKLDEGVRAIRDEMSYFRVREAEVRDLNENTNSQVAFLSILSLFVCVGLAALQLWHLVSFFHRKKIL